MSNNSTNTNNKKNGPATNIPPNQEAEDLIKSNKSVMQQLMAMTEENAKLKQELIDREARLMAIQEVINNTFGAATTECNHLYKEINKNLVVLSDLMNGKVTPEVQQGFNAIRQFSPERKTIYANNFRRAEGLDPIT